MSSWLKALLTVSVFLFSACLTSVPELYTEPVSDSDWETEEAAPEDDTVRTEEPQAEPAAVDEAAEDSGSEAEQTTVPDLSSFSSADDIQQEEPEDTQEYTDIAKAAESPETEPAETEPAETEPAETEPVETEPAETEPAETDSGSLPIAQGNAAPLEPAGDPQTSDLEKPVTEEDSDPAYQVPLPEDEKSPLLFIIAVSVISVFFLVLVVFIIISRKPHLRNKLVQFRLRTAEGISRTLKKIGAFFRRIGKLFQK